MSPSIFFDLMMTHVVPIVIVCMVVGAVLGLIVKMAKNAARRMIETGARAVRRR